MASLASFQPSSVSGTYGESFLEQVGCHTVTNYKYKWKEHLAPANGEGTFKRCIAKANTTILNICAASCKPSLVVIGNPDLSQGTVITD